MASKFDQLQTILNKMDVPEERKGDIRWLARNLGFKNSKHKDFDRALVLISELMITTTKVNNKEDQF